MLTTLRRHWIALDEVGLDESGGFSVAELLSDLVERTASVWIGFGAFGLISDGPHPRSWCPLARRRQGLSAVATDCLPATGWTCGPSPPRPGAYVTHFVTQQTTQAPSEVSRMGPDLRSRLGESNP
ncbi:hypothetical protein DV26_17650 [Amycolatopsis mediterranei]|nr:hypothetical protein DV26_17650 [Amycolatopsis mediterranei]